MTNSYVPGFRVGLEDTKGFWHVADETFKPEYVARCGLRGERWLAIAQAGHRPGGFFEKTCPTCWASL